MVEDVGLAGSRGSRDGIDGRAGIATFGKQLSSGGQNRLRACGHRFFCHCGHSSGYFIVGALSVLPVSIGLLEQILTDWSVSSIAKSPGLSKTKYSHPVPKKPTAGKNGSPTGPSNLCVISC